ncbi:MAG TPA: hypothetical protein VF707_09150, partial [Ardenticatenaceae bacterium]
ARIRAFAERAWPAGLLALFLAWGWHAQSLAHSVPVYGDVIEITWLLSWYDEALRTGQNPAVYPLAFYPGGWQIGTFGAGPIMIFGLLPLHWLGGPAFAYNVAVLLTFVVAYWGAYVLARRFVERLPAAIVALLFAFWGFRWFQTIGHLNVLLGSALIPWIVWALERALNAPARRWGWLALVGLLWGVSIFGTPYFVWISGLGVAGWLVGRVAAKSVGWRAALVALLVPSTIALLLGAPGIYWSWRASTDVAAIFYSLGEVDFWGSSLNSLPLPYLSHPWLGSFARSIYKGLPYEQGTVNLGLVTTLVAFAGLWFARRERLWWPALILAAAGLVLSLGLTLKWDGTAVQWGWTEPLNQALWSLGRTTKPLLFPGEQPYEPFDESFSLPGMLLAALVPFLERARVFARFALVGSLGLFLLAGAALSKVNNRYLQWALAALLVVEVVPPPLPSLPFPGATHPAFDWLAQQPLAEGQSIVDLVGAHPHTPVLMNLGESVWATRLHGKPTVAGASSVWPAETMFLFQWLANHPHAFANPDLAPALRFFGARYVLLHMRGDLEQGILEEARQNQEVSFVECFSPASEPGLWSYPICVLEVLPPINPNVNLMLEDGWSGQEAWGVWAEGTSSRSLWVATARREHLLIVELFPNCIEGQRQRVVFQVNGTPVGEHAWENCEAWSGEFAVPASLVQRGANDLLVQSDFAARPVAAEGQSQDTRELSVGFSRLKIEPAP